MIPQEVFKRRQRHNNTPQSILLILANFIVVFADATLFTNQGNINWFFWVVIALLAAYNVYTIRRNREEFNKITLIIYIASLVVLAGAVFLLKGQV